MRAFSPIFANLVLFAAAFGFGSLLRQFFPATFSRIDRIAVFLLGGVGLLGTILFVVGQISFSRKIIFSILAVGVILDFRYLSRSGKAPTAQGSKFKISVLPAVVIGVVLLVTTVAGIAEPTGDIKMDAISCHLLGPRVWLRDGLIRPVIDEATTAFPATVETQYAALMALGGQRAPGFFAVTGLLSILLIAAALALRSGLDIGGAWWVAAIIVTMPVLYRGAFGGFVDVIYCGFVLVAARVAFDVERPRHYVLFGMFCGLAMGTKYFGLFAGLLLAVCLFFLATVINNQEKTTVLKHLGIACAVAIAVAAPWYLRNWILLGCPIYPPPPPLLPYFHVQYLSAEALQRLSVRILREGRGMGRDPLSLLLLPFHLTFHPANFINGAGGIGLTPLALAPFGLLACRRNHFAKGLALFALLQMVAWFVIAQEARYLIHGYVIAAIFAVWGWSYVAEVSPKLGPWLSRLVIACSILYGLFIIGSARRDDLHAAVSTSFAERRRYAEIPFLESFEYLNRQPAVRKVLILDPRVPAYYSDKAYLKPYGRNGEQTLPEASDLPRMLTQLSRLQISHVLDVEWEGRSFKLSRNSKGLSLVFERNDQRIYGVD